MPPSSNCLRAPHAACVVAPPANVARVAGGGPRGCAGGPAVIVTPGGWAGNLPPPVVVRGPLCYPPMPVPQTVTIGVARDEAFSFYYQDGLDLLESRGARLVPFSPIHDRSLPDVHGLYLGAGFPEVHAAALSENTRMRAGVRDAAVSGVPVYAEGGGMMYLAQHLVDGAGREHAMAGVLPVSTSMQPRLAALGYVTLQATTDTLLLRIGESVRGHEFHFSTVTANGPVEF